MNMDNQFHHSWEAYDSEKKQEHRTEEDSELWLTRLSYMHKRTTEVKRHYELTLNQKQSDLCQ